MMKKMKLNKTTTASLIAGVLIVVGACQLENSKKNKIGMAPRPQAATSTDAGLFLNNAALCRQLTALGDAVADANNHDATLRGYTLRFQIEVCGEVKGDAAAALEGEAVTSKKWQALAITVDTPHVYLRASDSMPATADETKKAIIFANDKNQVIALRADGKQVVIGSTASVEGDAPVDLAPAVSLQLFIRGEPYALGKFPKDIPDTDKEIWVTSPEAN